MGIKQRILMGKSRGKRKSVEAERQEWRVIRNLLSGSVMAGSVTVVLSLLTTLFSSYISVSKAPRPNVLSINNNVLYFIGGIVSLGVVTVGIALLFTRRNREVMILKQ